MTFDLPESSSRMGKSPTPGQLDSGVFFVFHPGRCPRAGIAHDDLRHLAIRGARPGRQSGRQRPQQIVGCELHGIYETTMSIDIDMHNRSAHEPNGRR